MAKVNVNVFFAGNFCIFNKLLDIYKDDPLKYTMLDPNQRDDFGDGLFHIVAKAKYNKTTHKATNMLVEMKLSASFKNKSGALPQDCLENKEKDRRFQFFQQTKSKTKPDEVGAHTNLIERQENTSINDGVSENIDRPGRRTKKDSHVNIVS